MEKKAMRFLALIMVCLTSARIGFGFQWESTFSPRVLSPESTLTLHWSYTLDDVERKQASEFSMVIIEQERQIFSRQWQSLAVKIPFSGVYLKVSQSSNYYLMQGEGVGITLVNATSQGITRYRCTFLSGFSAPKQVIIPNIRVTNVRLVGASKPFVGRVEIFHDGQWGKICGNGWDLRDANVVCRMLGYRAAVRAYSYYFGNINGRIWLEGVHCQGTEMSITQCRHPPWGVHNCSYNEYAIVFCLANTVSTPSPYPSTRPYYTPWPTYTANPSPGYNPVRLVGGNSPSMGRVEILHNGQWGTICDDGWGISDARVVCRMLGYSSVYRALSSAYFGRGTGAIWLDEVGCNGNEPTISHCRHRPWGRHNCGHNEDAGVMCIYSNWSPPPRSTTMWPYYTTGYTANPSPGYNPVRLVGGNSSSMGRVEILHNGQWGTICDDGWGFNDARVVCRMLGYSSVYRALSSAYFGRGTGTIWLDDVNCNGNEPTISHCRHPPWGRHDCGHNEDAGVMCTYSNWSPTPSNTTMWPYYTTGYTANPSPGYNLVRLVGGNSPSMGRVEILHNGQWGTICDDRWDISDARVVCRMLGYSSVYRELRSAYFGRGTGTIWLDDVDCIGNEPTISHCRHRPWGSHNCGHHEDAGVMCTYSTWSPRPTALPTWRPTFYPTSGVHISVRLAGIRSTPFKGRVEVYHSRQWGTICDNGWDINDARVVCRMLGYSTAVSALSNARPFGAGSGRIWLDDVNCIGNESSISQCGHRGWGSSDCFHSEDAGVICNNTDTAFIPVRLVGGRVSNEGRVEIYYNYQWGTICDDFWDINDARVVCRMLNYSTAVSAVSNARFGAGSGRIWLDDVNCTGNESSISQCGHNGWGVQNCYHGEDAGAICDSAEPSEIQRITSTMYVRRGSNIILYCSATGYPYPTVKWIKNNKTLAFDISYARYFINEIQFYQAGAYYCIATNRYGSDINTTLVYVVQRPMNTFVGFNVLHGAAMIGDTVIVTCKTEAYPPATCTLYRHGNRLGVSSYTINSITSSDFGTYNCSCRNNLGSGSGIENLTLYEHPSIQTIWPRTQNISETDSFEIFCNATGSPLPRISWYKSIEKRRQVGFGKTFSVRKSSVDDEGTYTCTADNGRYQATATATVNIIFRIPRIISPPKNTTVTEDYNRSYYFYCNATGNPTPNITWFKVGKDKMNPVGRGEQLALTASWYHSGIYECVAENGIGGAVRKRAFYQVLHKPYSTQLKTNRDNNVVIGNAPINIICTTVANPPAYRYDIYLGNKHVTNSSSGLYSISKAKAGDQGTYTCVPRNTFGFGANASIEVHVFGALSIISAPKNTTVIENQKASLFCNASSSLYKIPLPPIIRWKKVGEIDLHFPDGEVLVLGDIQPKDAGVYECEAKNGIAVPETARATVVVQYKPRKTLLVLSTGGDRIYVNKTVSLVCKTIAVPPAFKFSFFHEGVKVGTWSNGVFNILGVSAEDNGTYSCVAENLIGEGPRASITLKFTECGVRRTKSSVQTRIIGGDASQHGGWPWQVQMAGTRYGRFYSHICGASIINNQWIVTAAHCVTQRLSVSYVVSRPESLNITVGEYNRSKIDGTEQEIPVERVLVHSNYNVTTLDYDIALLKLQRPMEFNSHVSPVCLPRFDFPENTICYITGWGRTTMAHYKSSIVLQEATVPLMDRARCKFLLQRIGRVTSRMRCNGYNGYPRSTCHGDSGGPLVCARDGIWYLMGITSWGSRDCSNMRYPSVYADVLYFKTWIKNTVEQYS